MTFSMKPQIPSAGSSASNEDWAEWNEYFFGLISGKEQPVKNKAGEVVPNRTFKKKKAVGIFNLVVDCGLQPQADSSYEWKKEAGSEDGSSKDFKDNIVRDGYSEEEKQHIAKYKNNYFKTVDGKRMQFKPEQPTQEYAFYFDFPSLEVDWTKHPIEDLHKLGTKPLRVCYNGYYKDIKKGVEDFGKSLRFSPNYKTGKLNSTNPIMKLATAMGKEDKFFENQDLGDLAGGACFFDLIITKTVSDGKVFFNQEIKGYSEITEMELPTGDTLTVEQQIPECDITPIGIFLNGGNYEESTLQLIRHDRALKAVLPRASSFKPSPDKYPDFVLGCNWEDSDLGKALIAEGWKSNTSNSSQDVSSKPQDTPSEPKEKEESKGTKKEDKPAEKAPEPQIDFESDIPFMRYGMEKHSHLVV